MLKELWHQPWRASGWMLALAVVNFVGAGLGFCWYQAQLAAHPFYLWPVIADSPVSTLLFAVALLLAVWGWRLPALQVLAVTVCIKYGVWAMALIGHYWYFYQEIHTLEVLLLCSHGGMVVQGLWFMRKLSVPLLALLVSGFWLFFNDAMDYLLHLHPTLFMAEQWIFAALTAVSLSVGLILVLIIRHNNHQAW